jgi:YegS/Rv2252/BmrU family lipid kinase
MDILLYNPLSRNGKNPKFIEKIVNHLKKEGRAVVSYSLLEIDDVEAFASECQKDDRIIIVGGDGTINHLANRIYNLDIKQEIFMYQAGTGNDFIRSLKTKDKVVPIKSYIKKLPLCKVNGKSRYFLNGAGAGLDGFVGHLVNTSKYKKNKLNYFRHAFEGFAKFKPVSATITIDGKVIKEKKLWFLSAMHGAYYGGGMKIAPKAHRKDDHLDLVIVKNVPKWILILIFPSIYFGGHVIFKKWVQIYQGKSILVNIDEPTYLQLDGDVEYPVEAFEVESI